MQFLNKETADVTIYFHRDQRKHWTLVWTLVTVPDFARVFPRYVLTPTRQGSCVDRKSPG